MGKPVAVSSEQLLVKRFKDLFEQSRAKLLATQPDLNFDFEQFVELWDGNDRWTHRFFDFLIVEAAGRYQRQGQNSSSTSANPVVNESSMNPRRRLHEARLSFARRHAVGSIRRHGAVAAAAEQSQTQESDAATGFPGAAGISRQPDQTQTTAFFIQGDIDATNVTGTSRIGNGTPSSTVREQATPTPTRNEGNRTSDVSNSQNQGGDSTDSFRQYRWRRRMAVQLDPDVMARFANYPVGQDTTAVPRVIRMRYDNDSRSQSPNNSVHPLQQLISSTASVRRGLRAVSNQTTSGNGGTRTYADRRHSTQRQSHSNTNNNNSPALPVSPVTPSTNIGIVNQQSSTSASSFPFGIDIGRNTVPVVQPSPTVSHPSPVLPIHLFQNMTGSHHTTNDSSHTNHQISQSMLPINGFAQQSPVINSHHANTNGNPLTAAVESLGTTMFNSLRNIPFSNSHHLNSLSMAITERYAARLIQARQELSDVTSPLTVSPAALILNPNGLAAFQNASFGATQPISTTTPMSYHPDQSQSSYLSHHSSPVTSSNHTPLFQQTESPDNFNPAQSLTMHFLLPNNMGPLGQNQ